MTLKEQTEFLRATCMNHGMVNDFFTGEQWDVEGKSKPGLNYPIIIATPISSSVNDQVINRIWQLACMDKPQKDLSDEQDILSDTEYILNSIIRQIHYNEEDIDVIGPVVIEPGKGIYGDAVTGWTGNINLETVFESHGCEIPEK